MLRHSSTIFVIIQVLESLWEVHQDPRRVLGDRQFYPQPWPKETIKLSHTDNQKVHVSNSDLTRQYIRAFLSKFAKWWDRAPKKRRRERRVRLWPQLLLNPNTTQKMDRKMEPERTTRTKEPGTENMYETWDLQNFDVFKVENVWMPLKLFLDTPGHKMKVLKLSTFWFLA